MTQLYRLGDISIKSDTVLPFPADGDGGVVQYSLETHEGHRSLVTDRHITNGSGIFTTKTSTLLQHPSVGDVEIHEHGHINYVRSPTYCQLSFDHFFLGPVAAALASRAQMTALHASCVARGDVAVLIVGPSGCGKSTLAAFMVKAGWSLLSDDLALIALCDEQICCYPSSNRSWLDACSCAALRTDTLGKESRSDGKVAIIAENRVIGHKFDVSMVLFPEFSSSLPVQIDRLSSQNLVAALLSEIAGLAMLDDEAARKDRVLSFATRAQHVKGFKLSRPRDFGGLHETYQAIENLLHSLPQ